MIRRENMMESSAKKGGSASGGAAGLQKTFKIRTRTLKATAEVNNLFGQDYDVVLNYPMPKTNFRFVVSVDL